jgi:hypothetical protein
MSNEKITVHYQLVPDALETVRTAGAMVDGALDARERGGHEEAFAMMAEAHLLLTKRLLKPFFLSA